MKNSNILTNTAIGGGIVGILFLLIVSPALIYLFAYIGGVILRYFVGDSLVFGINNLLGRDAVTWHSLPTICATLAVVGRYFKSSQTNNNNKN